MINLDKNLQPLLYDTEAGPSNSNGQLPLEMSQPKKGAVRYVHQVLSKTARRRLKILGIVLLVFVVLCAFFAFVGFPLIFMNSLALQRLLMFTNLGLPSDVSYFRKYELKPGLRNFYVTVKDSKTDNLISLGAWHLLPYFYQEDVITHQNFNFDEALKNSNLSVLLYFHGTGEDRSSSIHKYSVFRYFFHVIAFDYRSYGDSSTAELSEDAVINDCLQLYEWLTTKTQAPIFIWGHSLGSALATRTVSTLRAQNVTQPIGLILEGAFTRMSEELYVHPYGKIFSWLPWFEATVVKPLEKNGFIFDTQKHIQNVTCPIMILCAEDDSVVPYTFGKKLAQIMRNKTQTLYYQFDADLDYDHYFLYRDKFLPFFIK